MRDIRKILRRKLNPLPPCPEKPIELKGEAASFACRYAVIYVGNGASGQHYDSLLSNTGLKYHTYEGLGGRADTCAVIYFQDGERMQALENGFEHDEAVLIGFILRKKIDGEWRWMCNDGQWHGVSEQMPEKKLYAEGSAPDLAQDDLNGILVFEAVWQLPDGTCANEGYRMFRNPLMAHALGGMNGKEYHNTMAAYENAMTKGYGYYEVDLSMTVDGRMVLCHGWSESNCEHTGFEYSEDLDQTMTYNKLMGLKVHGNPQIDLRSFYKVMLEHPDHLYEFDLHSVKGKKAVSRVEEIIRDCKGDRKVFDRVLMQVYSNKMYQAVDSTYHFRTYQYIIGKPDVNLYEKIPFLIDEGISAAAIPARLACPEYVGALRNAGIYVLAYTVKDDREQAKRLLGMGVNTVCTDYVTPADIREE